LKTGFNTSTTTCTSPPIMPVRS